MKAIERLYKYLTSKGIKPGTFEKDMQLSQGYLGKMYRRKADMGEGIILQIIEHCPELNLIWLMTGKGEMTQNHVSENIAEAGHSLDSDFYKVSLEERKEEIAEKDKEIARLNILIGRYEERLANFQQGKSYATTHGGSVPHDDLGECAGAPSEVHGLPLSSQGTGESLNPQPAGTDE